MGNDYNWLETPHTVSIPRLFTGVLLEICVYPPRYHVIFRIRHQGRILDIGMDTYYSNTYALMSMI